MMIPVSLTLVVELNRFSNLFPRFSRIIDALAIEDREHIRQRLSIDLMIRR